MYYIYKAISIIEKSSNQNYQQIYDVFKKLYMIISQQYQLAIKPNDRKPINDQQNINDLWLKKYPDTFDTYDHSYYLPISTYYINIK